MLMPSCPHTKETLLICCIFSRQCNGKVLQIPFSLWTFTEENEKILPTKCPAHLVHSMANRGWFAFCNTEAFIAKCLVTSQFPLNMHLMPLELFDILEMKGDGLL